MTTMYGFAEKARMSSRICPICKKTFNTTSKRRKYCYAEECAKARYFNKLKRKKAKWHLYHPTTTKQKGK